LDVRRPKRSWAIIRPAPRWRNAGCSQTEVIPRIGCDEFITPDNAGCSQTEVIPRPFTNTVMGFVVEGGSQIESALWHDCHKAQLKGARRRKRAKRVYLALHPETKRGGGAKGTRGKPKGQNVPLDFAGDIAAGTVLAWAFLPG
jgi:hypothetical protein